jgi:putative ABC transport system permease protein
MKTLLQDLRYGFRMMARKPGFTIVVVLILAMGIGANTAIFSVINAVLLRPLPYREPDRIVRIWMTRGKALNNMFSRSELQIFRDQNETFESVAGHCGRRVYLSGIDTPRHIYAEEVSPGLFPLLGVQPALGRGFLPEEEKLGKDRVVILSDIFWRDHFASAPDAIGKTLILDNVSHTIVGVMPPDFRFRFRSSASFWIPMPLENKSWGSPPCFILARLKKGGTIEQAQVRMGVMAHRLAEMNPKAPKYALVLHRLTDDLFAEYRRMLLLSFGATGFLLLIACSNAGNLLLARAMLRRREIAIRMALGFSRWNVLRQLLTECVVLSLVAGLLGLLVTLWATKGLEGMFPANIPRMREVRVDMPVLFFGLGVSILTGLVFGLIPAWKASELHLIEMLKGTRLQSIMTSRSRRWLSVGLIISQISISVILLAGSGLLIRSLVALETADLGFKSDHLLSMHVELPEVKYPERSQCKAFFEQLLERVRGVPGIKAAAIGYWTGRGSLQFFSIEGRPPAGNEEKPLEASTTVSPDYFKAMGLRVLKGRTFTKADLSSGILLDEPIVIDEKLAREYFGNVDPIGQRLRFTEHATGTIVGVVGSVHNFEDMTPAYGRIYKPRYWFYSYVHDLVIRTEGDPEKFVGALRSELSALDKEQAQAKIETVETELCRMLAPQRFNTILIGLSAGIALALATAGIYGLMAFSTSQRTGEIGIRMAFGARSSDVLKAVMGQGLKLTFVGIGLGLAGAHALTRVLSSMLYDVNPTDPLTFVCVSLVLASVALLACYIPARRAAEIDPMEALQYE